MILQIFLGVPTIVVLGSSASSSELASRYGLTISEFDNMISSEAPEDFGVSGSHGLSVGQELSDDLFLTATARQWDFNQRSILADLGPSNVYYPYIACYSDPELSGYRRILHLNNLFALTGMDNSIFIGETIVNVRKARTCVWTSSLVNPYKIIADTQPEDTTQYLEFQPHMFSMKIIDGSTELIAERMTNPEPGRNLLGVVVRTCPVYSEYASATQDDLTDALVQFLADKELVHNSSFYVESSQNQSTVSTPRMDWWANTITNVTDRTDPTSGANECLDVVIAQKLKFALGFKDTINVYIESADGVDLTEAELQDCLWYVVAGLALHPYSCQIEPEIYKVPLPPIPTLPDSSSENGPSSGYSDTTTSSAFSGMMGAVCGAFSVIASLMFAAQ